MPHSQSCIFQSDPCCTTKKSKLPDFFVVSNNSFLTIKKKKATLKRWGKAFISLQQLPGNLSMTAENRNSSPMQLEVFSPKPGTLWLHNSGRWKHMWPFLLRILRTGSKSDIYFGNKIWRESSPEHFQIYRRKITVVKFTFPLPFQGNSSGSWL